MEKIWLLYLIGMFSMAFITWIRVITLWDHDYKNELIIPMGDRGRATNKRLLYIASIITLCLPIWPLLVLKFLINNIRTYKKDLKK